MGDHKPEWKMSADDPEETPGAHTAQLVKSIVAAFYKPMVEEIGGLEDRLQALERRVHELEHSTEKPEQGRRSTLQ